MSAKRADYKWSLWHWKPLSQEEQLTLRIWSRERTRYFLMNFRSSLNREWEATHAGEMKKREPCASRSSEPRSRNPPVYLCGSTQEQPPQWLSKHQQHSKAWGVCTDHQAPGNWRVPRQPGSPDTARQYLQPKLNAPRPEQSTTKREVFSHVRVYSLIVSLGPNCLFGEMKSYETCVWYEQFMCLW